MLRRLISSFSILVWIWRICGASISLPPPNPSVDQAGDFQAEAALPPEHAMQVIPSLVIPSNSSDTHQVPNLNLKSFKFGAFHFTKKVANNGSVVANNGSVGWEAACPFHRKKKP